MASMRQQRERRRAERERRAQHAAKVKAQRSRSAQAEAAPSFSPEEIEQASAKLSAYFSLARGFEPAGHQHDILSTVQRFLEDCWSRPAAQHDGLRVLDINLPPGAGKSAIISATLPPWVLGQRPFERIGIISAKGDLASMFEVVTKVDIESGEVYAACFPDADARPDRSRGWAKGTLYLQGLPHREVTPSIATSGLFGSIIGKRFTLIILDDPQDQESAGTPGQRRKTWEFINGTVGCFRVHREVCPVARLSVCSNAYMRTT